MHFNAVTYQYPTNAHFKLTIPPIEMKDVHILNLVGENGSGKSTWAKVISGLLGSSKDESKWQYIPQYAEQFLFAENINEQVRYLFENDFNKDRYKVELSELDLPYDDDYFDFPLALMSAGELRRVMLAFAFYFGKKYMILDEPTIGLGPKESLVLMNKINTFKAMGNELIIISHQQKLLNLGQGILAFKNGALHFSGSLTEANALEEMDDLIG